MIPSFLTTILWAVCVVAANRATKFVGSVRANFSRLCLAAVLLAVWAHLFGQGLRGAGLWWFVFSGCVGFGIGDIAAYEAFPRIGPRLTVLMMQCLAAPIGAVVEWLWLGTTLKAAQIACAVVILVGVALALAPKDHVQMDRRGFLAGAMLGVLAALGQGCGAVLSRKAYQVEALTGLTVDGGTAAYQRILGGIVIALAFFLLVRARGEDAGASRDWRRAWPWIVFHTVTGPTVGVACFQWALATTPSGVVLPIVAMTPLAVMPLAYFMEGDRPGRGSIIGGVIAVAGAVGLTMVR